METLFLINFFICTLLLGAGMLLDYRLFKSLQKNHPTYYKSIGKPLIVMMTPTDFTWDDYLRLIIGGAFGYKMVFRGLPEEFPKDAKLRRLAQAIRIVLTILLVLLIPMVTVGYFFFKSTS